MTLNPKLDSSCVLCLPFGEESGSTAYDQSLYSNNGTIYGATRTLGKIGKALIFDGLDDYVDCRNNNSLNITEKLTMAAWVKPAPGTGGFGIIGTPGFGDAYGMYVRHSPGADGTVRFTTADNVNHYVYGGTLSYGEWVFIAGVWDGTTLKLFINGVRTGTENTMSYTRNFRGLLIGRTVGILSPEYFNGLIDEVRIYNRALSAKEILEHYVYGVQSLRRPRFPEFRRETRRELWPAAVV